LEKLVVDLDAMFQVRVFFRKEDNPSFLIFWRLGCVMTPVFRPVTFHLARGRDLRALVSREIGLPVGIFRLTTDSGVEIFDCNVLEDYGLQIGSTVNLDTWDGWNELIRAAISGVAEQVCRFVPQGNGNSLLYAVSQANKLQRVQNILARAAVGAPCTCSTLNIRRDLHWLPVGHRITYKLSHYLENASYLSASLLSELISHYVPCRSLRSSKTKSLPDHAVLLATFPPEPFLCLHLVLGTFYLHTFILSTPYPPLNTT